ncbi:MAG: M3 family metallopeptidase [Bacteroidales bacterium]|nr:M3 family metallopeptidase [Bacteroidales bacterium]
MNPLTQQWKTHRQTPPFNEIKTEHYLPAFEEAIANAKQEIEQIANNPIAPDFENTIVALDRAGEQLSTVADLFFNILECNGDDEMHKVAEEVQPLLVQYENEVYQHPGLFARVKAVHDRQKQDAFLTGADKILLDRTYDAFVSGGANLPETEKQRYRELSLELANRQLDFGQRSLKATNAWHVHLEKESLRLAGIPEGALALAAQKAADKGLEGYVFDLSAPDVNTVLTYADDRSLREEVYMHSSKKAYGGEFDNCDNIKAILKCREEIAHLLGYKHYADYALRNRMAKDLAHVYKLLDELKVAALPAAKREIEELRQFAQKQGFNDTFQRWDLSYYMEKLRQEKFQLETEKLKVYFPLNQVIDGVFGLATTLYDLRFVKTEDIQPYYPDVQVYEVYRGEQFMSVLYLDFHPRSTKRSGAWMTEFRDQHEDANGNDIRPWVSLVMNFTPPTKEQPSLLTVDEVNTFLHEFGHALNGMLSEVKYATLSGTHSPRDFVELPSQLNENWLTEPEFLRTFARHYQTGELIPEEYVAQLKNMNKFMAGYLCVRQLSFGYLDMMWHTMAADDVDDILRLERSIFDTVEVLPVVPGACMSTAFGHLFSGGYAAGYYGYKWAEMLEADAFSLFKENGVMNHDTAQRYLETILSKGGSVDAMEMFVNFRGREPKIDALLERDGLLAVGC